MFYVQLLHQQSCASKVKTKNVSTKSCAELTYVKAERRKLVKLTPDVQQSLDVSKTLKNTDK
jgi:hypothetical protein